MARGPLNEDDGDRQRDPLANLLAQGLPTPSGGSADAAPENGVRLDATPAPDVASSADPGPIHIPGYELLHEIGRGGMGRVYLAMQLSTRRRVAIKVMAEGPLVSSRARRRFTHEAEILAQLNHPNIVTIHDSGIASGVSYYVMDYIVGQRLDDWLADKARPINECLHLFAQICVAVAAAHLRGVMHRDLKPANILVDGEGRPHVLDFGLAKLAAEERDGEQPSIMTMTGQFMGTLPWASPEQAETIPGRIDVRTDIYSLGVILYQMLTGRFPYAVTGTIREVLDQIISADPIRPSRVRRRIDNEIETIILKCLEKEPAQRYQSAGELARDIGHYLAGEPIEAKRQSLRYILYKQLRRHRLAVAVAAAFVLVVSAGSVISTILWQRAVAERKQTEAERRRLHDETCLRRVAQAQYACDLHKFGWTRQLLFSCPARLRGWEWRYLVAQLDRSARTLYRHTDWVKHVAFSPDSSAIATVGYKGQVVEWDRQDGGILWHDEVPDSDLDYVAFSPDGAWIVATGTTPGGVEQLICTWPLDTPDRRCTASSAKRGSGSIVFLDERTFVVATADGIESWDGGLTRWGSPCDVSPLTQVTCLAVNRDRTRVVAAGKTSKLPEVGAIRLWHVDRQNPRAWQAIEMEDGTDYIACADCVDALAFSPDEQVLAATTSRGSLLRFDTATGRLLGDPLHAVDGKARAVAWSPDGRRIAVAGDDQVIRLFDTEHFDERPTLFTGHYAPVTSLVFHPRDPGTLVSCSDDGTTKVWQTPIPENPARLRMENDHALAMAFSPDGRHLALGGRYGEVELWTEKNKQWQRTMCLEDFSQTEWTGSIGDHLRDVCFSADGELLAAAGWRDEGDREDRTTVCVWEVRSGQLLHELVADEQGTCALAFSPPDGRWLATAGTDRCVKLWEMRRAHERDLPMAHKVIACRADDQLLTVAFSPDGHRLAWGSDGRNAAIWCLSLNADGGQTAPKLVQAGHTHGIRAISFLPQGDLLVSGSNDCTVRISDVRTGQLVRTLHRGRKSILDVAVSADGRRAAACGWDHTVRVWDIQTGVQVALFDQPRGAAQRLAFSPDGCRLACIDEKGTVWVWLAATLEEVQRSPAVGVALAETATEMMADGQYEDARDIFAEAVAILQDTLLPDNPRGRRLIEQYMAACEKAGQSEEARQCRTLLNLQPTPPSTP